MNKLRQIIREEIRSILKEDLESSLKDHDWYFNYADDGRVYRKGEKELENILTLIKQTDPKIAKTLWDRYAPKDQKFPSGVYKQPVKKIIDDTPKYEKKYKKGDKVLVEGADGVELYDRYLGKIVKEDGWEFRSALNTYYAKYQIKVEKVFSKSEKQLSFEGQTVTAFEFHIKGKK